MIKQNTYMGFPNHCFLWAQWTSEKMNLRTGKEGGGGVDGGKERNTTIKIKHIELNGTKMTGHQCTN